MTESLAPEFGEVCLIAADQEEGVADERGPSEEKTRGVFQC